MVHRIMVTLVVAASLSATAASAQEMKVYHYNDRTSRADIIPFYGYAWTFSHDYYYGLVAGTFDLKDTGYFGVNVDVNVRPGSQVRLMYRRQNTDIQFRSLTTNKSISGAVEYWQIGGLTGMQRNNMLPYGMVTLGATRYMAQSEDVWKFSMILGLGAKVYTQGKLGVEIQGSLPFTFVSGGGSISFGSGGVYTSIGGSGLGQIDVSAGLVISLR